MHGVNIKLLEMVFEAISHELINRGGYKARGIRLITELQICLYLFQEMLLNESFLIAELKTM